MKLDVEITLPTNVAEYRTQEIPRLLRQLSFKIEEGETSGKIRGLNGKTIGKWSLK